MKPRHVAHLTEQITAYRRYLDHADPAVRLVGLQSILTHLDALITRDNALAHPKTAAASSLRLTDEGSISGESYDVS